MNKRINLNSAMRKIFNSKVLYVCVLPSKKHITKEIDAFFKSVTLYEKNGKKCFSTKNIFESNVHTPKNELSIVNWEWDTNEIYLDKSLIKINYKKSIIWSINIIERRLRENFSGNSFVISFCIQSGRFRNINIRIFQDLGYSLLNENLDEYSQPILQVYLKT